MRHLLAETKGHVWTLDLKSEEEAGKVEREQRVFSKQYTEQGIRLRFVGEKAPYPGCEPGTVSLEDAYLYVMMGGAKR